MNSAAMKPQYQRDPELVSTIMDGDTVMMDVERGEYFGLGGVGSRIWELLEFPVSIDHLTETICAEFEVDAAICRSDAERFLAELQQKGMVHQIK